MARRDIVVAGTSAGGVEALKTLVRGLPPDYKGSLLIVIHIGSMSVGLMPEILSRVGPLPAKHPDEGEIIRPGQIYVAPPDRHLLIQPGERLHLSRGPKENFARPAIDPLFRSAALHYGERAAGVILTGYLDDGTAGLFALKERGGLAIIQDPKDAEIPAMPRNALRYVKADYCLKLKEIPMVLADLAKASEEAEVKTKPDKAMSKDLELEVAIASNERARLSEVRKLGSPSLYVCPECQGTLSRMHDAHPPRFRCHTGHAYSIGSLESEMTNHIEASLWNAIRSLEEFAILLKERSGEERDGEGEKERIKADGAIQKAQALRQLLAE
ncbi:MAG: chemotaxis protein CheB [Rhodomicrobium sp.]